HILVLVVHHIVSDGWSQGIVLRELSALYQGFVQHNPVVLPELPLHYADYAVWQRQWLQGAVLDQQLAYWQAQLADLAPLDLPTDRPRPPMPSYRGRHYALHIPAALTVEVQQLSQRLGATLYMTLLAAWQTLLARYSGQTDIAVGTPIAGRVRPEFEGLIGFFVNTLVLRTDLAGNPSFAALLERVRSVCLQAYAHQDVPFELLVEAVQPERDLSRTPLFQVMFILQNTPRTTIALPDLTFEPLAVESQTAKFDLSLMLHEKPDGLYGSVEYSTDLFDTATIERLAEHFQMLLAGIVADPNQAITALPLLTTSEQALLLQTWNATEAAYPQDQCVHTLIEAQAMRTPDAVALVCGAETLTYAALDQRANQLAHHLRSLGVGGCPQGEVRVGVCLHRSLDLLVALLGILKAGGCYVPLDPSYPAERIQFVLHDAQAAVLVTQQALLPTLPAHDGQTLCLDTAWPQIARQPMTPPATTVTPDHLAYVLYTSGSTGRPKGVQISQRALVNFLCAMQRQPGLGPQDVLLAVTTIAFDIAGLELFLPLLVGARLVLVPRAEAIDGARLVALLDATGATVLQATPATWQLLLAAGWTGTPGLTALCGGEALPWELAEALLGRVARLWNLYGPTETTVWSAAGPVAAGAGRVALGQPIANTQLYVVDGQLRLVGLGTPGELLIGGHGVARGYHGRPALTAERFVPDGFGGAAGARVYRTGDRVRYRADGTLEFLGRLDQQVKVRGYRIELGEIEAVLRQHAAIREAVVVVRADTPGDARLVAYVVAHQEPGADGSPGVVLGAFLRERLPEYMVPSAFVVVEALPLTPNGKVDRKALPPPEDTAGRARAAYVAPRTPLEEVIAGVWRAVLGVAAVSVEENFFALGGHSLRATQVVTRLRQVLGHEVPLRLLFEAPTVAGLAARLTTAQAEGILTAPPVPHERAALSSDHRIVPLSFAQQRLWFLDQLEPGSAAYHLPLVVRLHGTLDVAALHQALSALVERHAALRTTFAQSADGETDQPVQVIAPALDVPLSVSDAPGLLEAESQAVFVQIVRAAIQQPFDLRRGPLLRATLYRQGPHDHILVLVVHHIVSDGWSQGIVLRELSALYQGFVQHNPVVLPELPLHYA
ncbi:MAG TPA: amino acid adenylation domain-containing protein, partial [Herpetosiphonaceae bacterium]